MDANVTDLRIVKTRTNIKNSLIDLLAEKNVSKITVTELAEKAMINRKTFYRHYHTVQDVVDDINYDIINDVISHAKKSDRDGNNLVNQLNFIGLSIVENKEQINKILKNSPEVFGSGRSVELLKRFIEVSIRPVLNFKNETKLKYLVEFVVSGFISVYGRWFNDGCAESSEKLADAVNEFVLGALSEYVPPEKLINSFSNEP